MPTTIRYVLYRKFLQLVDLLPLPSLKVQRYIAFVVILAQSGIAVTGSIVRVTSSGLGCPTWPQCFPGSFTPVVVDEVAQIHSAVEFGNRLITFIVLFTSALIVLVVTRARRRTEVLIYAWLMPGSTILQAVLGGITVLTGLLWWTVAAHLLVSMMMIWLSVLLFIKIGENDQALPTSQVPPALRLLTGLSAAALSAVLVLGTFVTGAGPHAGDKSTSNPVPRLNIEITTLVHAHSQLLVAYLALLVGLGFAFISVSVNKKIKQRLAVLIGVVVSQAAVGIIQYLTDVPAALVAVHVAGAAACTVATAALWGALRARELPAESGFSSNFVHEQRNAH